VQLKRRHDLIPNLVETVKGAMSFEQETLAQVIAARNQAIATTRPAAELPSAEQVQATAAAEGQLTSSLSRLFAVVEAYPELKATANVAQLQEELTSTENKIAFARQLYTAQATEYNTRQMQFPASLVAGVARATPAQLWEITDAAEREVVKVDLSLHAKK
jgi:LemA protein